MAENKMSLFDEKVLVGQEHTGYETFLRYALCL